jgi:hypothetical protein
VWASGVVGVVGLARLQRVDIHGTLDIDRGPRMSQSGTRSDVRANSTLTGQRPWPTLPLLQLQQLHALLDSFEPNRTKPNRNLTILA